MTFQTSSGGNGVFARSRSAHHIVGFLLALLLVFPGLVHAKDTRVNAIVLFDGPNGPAYVQITGLMLNGKTELRVCDGVTQVDKHAYDLMLRAQLAGASSLERGKDGALMLTVNDKPVCVVPSALKFEKNVNLTPAAAADQTIIEGLLVSSSIQGQGIPAFKPGVRLIIVAALDEELAAYLTAQRGHTAQAWQDFLTRYPSSARASSAKQEMAAIYEDTAESAFAEYRKAARSTDFAHLKQAEDQAEMAEKTVAGYAPTHKLREQIGKELDALLDPDRTRLQAYRKALSESSAGYLQLAAALQHSEEVLAVDPHFAPAASLHAEIAGEQRKVNSALQSAEALLAGKRYDDALSAVAPYRSFAGEVPRVDAILSTTYAFHFARGQAFAWNQTWEPAAVEFRKASEIRSGSKEAAAALKNAEVQLGYVRDQQEANRAVAASNSYAEKGQIIEAYETLADLTQTQQLLVADRLTALEKSYVPAAFRKAQKLQEVHLPIRGRADEDAVRQAYELLERACALNDDPAMKLRTDLLSDKISSYYLEQARKYLNKPSASGVGLGWLYLGEADRYNPNVTAVKEAMARYASAYQLRSKLTLGVMLRDQTSRRDSGGFADQLRDAIVNGLESSGLPIKALRQVNDRDPIQPNFLVVAEILDHRVVKNTSLETLQSKYRAGTHDVKNEAWLQANQDFEAAQQQLAVAQLNLSDAQTQHKKKEIVSAATDAFVAAQRQVADARHKLDTTDQTRSQNVIEPYNYTKKTFDLTAIVDTTVRVTDQSGNVLDNIIPVKANDHKLAVVLENVKPEDTEGVREQSTEPDEVQFLTNVELQARDTLVKSIRERVALLPARILAEARIRAQRNDLDGAAEEYVLYLNTVSDSSQDSEEAARFLHDNFNLTVAQPSASAAQPTFSQSARK